MLTYFQEAPGPAPAAPQAPPAASDLVDAERVGSGYNYIVHCTVCSGLMHRKFCILYTLVYVCAIFQLCFAISMDSGHDIRKLISKLHRQVD